MRVQQGPAAPAAITRLAGQGPHQPGSALLYPREASRADLGVVVEFSSCCQLASDDQASSW